MNAIELTRFRRDSTFTFEQDS